MSFEMINAKELKKYLKLNSVILIDLREKEEYKQRHIADAINIPYEELDANLYKLPQNREIILYCERGGISFMAAKQLSEKGFLVKTLVGGIRGYNMEKLE